MLADICSKPLKKSPSKPRQAAMGFFILQTARKIR